MNTVPKFVCLWTLYKMQKIEIMTFHRGLHTKRRVLNKNVLNPWNRLITCQLSFVCMPNRALSSPPLSVSSLLFFFSCWQVHIRLGNGESPYECMHLRSVLQEKGNSSPSHTPDGTVRWGKRTFPREHAL